MKYAVIQTGGQQLKVIEGETISIPKLNEPVKAKVAFDQVLLVVDDDKVKLGKPFIKNAKVNAEVVKQIKTKKVKVIKFKAKSRYRRVHGHRQQMTLVKIVKINV